MLTGELRWQVITRTTVDGDVYPNDRQFQQVLM
jgi:hypothetical protein